MMQVKILFAALALACVCRSAMGQQTCITAASLQINATSMAGVWYESQRNPASATPLSCARVNLTAPDANTLSALVQFSNVAGSSEMTAQSNWNVSLANFSAATGYTVTTPANTTVVYKLLLQDPSSYALFCSYTNASDTSSIVGYILSRQTSFDAAGTEAVASLVYGIPQASWVAVNQTACVLAEPSTTTQATTSTTKSSGSSGSTESASSSSTGASLNTTSTPPETTTQHTGGASGTTAPVVLLVTAAMYALVKSLN